MTVNRSQKAEIRAFAAANNVSYTEARRLMELDTLIWEAIDEASGVSLEASMHGNLVDLRWDFPDGRKSGRTIRTHVLLDMGIWPASREAAFTEKGEVRAAWDSDKVLPAALTERLREWVAKIVQKPAVLSEDEQQFLYFSRQPEDYAITVVDKQAQTATVHMYRNPNPVEAPEASPIEIVAAHAQRFRALQAAAAPLVAAAHGNRDLSGPDFYYTYDSFPPAGESLERTFEAHRFIMSKELQMQQAGGLNPEELAWSIMEHTDF